MLRIIKMVALPPAYLLQGCLPIRYDGGQIWVLVKQVQGSLCHALSLRWQGKVARCKEHRHQSLLQRQVQHKEAKAVSTTGCNSGLRVAISALHQECDQTVVQQLAAGKSMSIFPVSLHPGSTPTSFDPL
jgi:hypothetical protein